MSTTFSYPLELAPFEGDEVIEINDYMRRIRAKDPSIRRGFGHPARDGRFNPEFMIFPEYPRDVPMTATHVYWTS